jgi:hypothetical protein
MFVDDLHIISNSMSGLLAIIEAIIEECSKQGIIINLNKSKLLLNESQATQNADLLKTHEILNCFEIQNTGIYLGAHIQSGAPNTYAHIQKRMAKAHAAISEMNLKGFKIQTLGRKTINKIITSIIIPILTYGLEAFPVSTLNYRYLDNFVSKTLHNTWNNQEEIDQSTTETPLMYWRLYEQDITPPSLIIKRNKLSIYLKSKNNQKGLNAALLKSYKSNFLLKEIKSLQLEWKFSIDALTNSYKGTKLTPKEQITELLNQAIDEQNVRCLQLTNWDGNTEGQYPSRIPPGINKPQIKFMKLREKTITSLTTYKCTMCTGSFQSYFLHELNDCAHPLRQHCRSQLWNSIEAHSHDLHAFLKTLTTIQLTRVMAGLIQTESEETNVFLTKLTNEIYC